MSVHKTQHLHLQIESLVLGLIKMSPPPLSNRSLFIISEWYGIQIKNNDKTKNSLKVNGIK